MSSNLKQILIKAVLFTVLICCSLNSYSQTNTQLNEYLNTQPLIRIYVSFADGFGHQAASMAIIRELRTLGYKNWIEVVYDVRAKRKISYLQPLFSATGADEQIFENHKIQFVSNILFKNRPKTIVELGITGGQDFHPDMNEKKLAVKHYLKLQPQNWHWPSKIISTVKGISTQLNLASTLNLQGFSRMNSTETLLELEHFRNHEDLSKKINSLNSIINNRSQFEFMSLYGLGINAKTNTIIDNLHRGLLKYKENSNDANRPTVVFILSQMNTEETAEIAKLINPTRIIDLTSPTFETEIAHLNSNSVTFVQVGRLSQPLFEWFIEQSDLPVLVAGKNAMDLAIALKKPFVSTVSDFDFPEFRKMSMKDQYELLAIKEIMFTKNHSEQKTQILATFLEQSKNVDFPLRAIYRKTPVESKLQWSLNEFLRRLTKSQKTCSNIYVH